MPRAGETPRPRKTPSDDSPAESLGVETNADGSSTLKAHGPAVVAGIGLVAVVAFLVVAPQLAVPLGLAVGAILGGALSWFVWSLAARRLAWRKVWQTSEFTATRKKDGKLQFQGIGAAAYPLAALLVILAYYVLASNAAWALWTGIGVAILVALGIVGFDRYRKTHRGAPMPAEPAADQQP
jgi:multidrug transporter EmrE-like cation transporter